MRIVQSPSANEQRLLRQQREQHEAIENEKQQRMIEQQRRLAQQQQPAGPTQQTPVWYHGQLAREDAESILFQAGASGIEVTVLDFAYH